MNTVCTHAHLMYVLVVCSGARGRMKQTRVGQDHTRKMEIGLSSLCMFHGKN